MDDRPDTRPEIEPCFWDITNLKWPIKGKTKPDLIIFDPCPELDTGARGKTHR